MPKYNLAPLAKAIRKGENRATVLKIKRSMKFEMVAYHESWR
jgi:hypothetical protein